MIDIHDVETTWGHLGRAGRLGYACPETGDKALIGDVHCDEILSAHPDSVIDLTFTKPVVVGAAANPSCFNELISCYVDWHRIGMITDETRRTPSIHLAPGRYRLRMKARKPGHGAHAVWLIRQDAATRDRLALMAYCYYPAAKLDWTCWGLFDSAARRGLHVRCVGVDEKWDGLARSKILRTRQHLDGVPSEYRHVMLVDAADTVIVVGEGEIAGRLHDLPIIGAEACLWPVRHPDWAALFQSETSTRFPNSGVIAGEIDAVKSLFDRASSVYRDCNRGTADGIIAKYRHWAWNDQFVWQAVVAAHPDRVLVDTSNTLAVNLGCGGGQLVGNPQASIEGKRVRSQHGTYPCVVHCCGPAGPHLKLWHHALYP